MKKILIFLFLFLVVAFSASAQDYTLTIHYHRFDGNYDGWGIHLWGAVEESGGTFYINGVPYDWQNPYPFDGQDEYGMHVSIPIADTTEALGFIVHKGEEKDPGPDRSFSDYDQTNEIWLLQGIMEIYYEEPSTDIRMMAAFGNGIDQIEIQMVAPIDDYESRFGVLKQGEEESIASITSDDGKKIVLTLENDIDITVLYEVYDTSIGDTLAVIHNFPVDDYVYDGTDLGITYSSTQTDFKLWSPTASVVNVLIYETPNDESETPESYPMVREGDGADVGVLNCTVEGDLVNKYYLYEITMFGETYTTPDPYSIGLSTNSERSMIVDLDATDPEGWETDTYPQLDAPEDAVIWEIHIRDLTIADSWNGTEENRGRYLGMVESGTTYEGMPTGFDHILDLGVTAVQILPMYDFSSVDESITGNSYNRNWGYDPYAYNVPEGSYSSDPSGTARITEMKQMIKGFHDAGIQVIMDVVYNHTHYTGRQSLFDNVAPKYYYQIAEDGSYVNATGVGNTIDTDKPMVRNFIRQSVKYWVEEYHIDGFRFDLMGLIETDLMENIASDIHAINPSAQIYGEPWGGWGSIPITEKGDQKNKGFGVFNDNIRNGIRGDTDGTAKGYAMGDTDRWNTIKKGVMGAIDDFTADPEETINYVSAHDNYTWFDKIERSVDTTDYYKTEMNKLGQAIVLTGQGLPFIHAGAEFQRTKRVPGLTDDNEEWVRNSYNAPDAVNELDWDRKYHRMDVYEYYKGLVALRNVRDEFKLEDQNAIRTKMDVHEEGENGTMTFTISDVTPDDDWGDIMVSYNPTAETQYISLPAGKWNVVVNEEYAGTEPLETIDGGFGGEVFPIAPYSAKVMYKTQVTSLNLNAFQNPALNNYLHFAINVMMESPENTSLTINEDVIEIEEIADNTWYISYKMSAVGSYELVLSVDDYTLTRYFTVGEVSSRGGFGTSHDGNVIVNFAPNSYHKDIFFAIFDSDINHALEAGSYDIGTEEIMLRASAEIKFKSDEMDQAIFRFDSGEWIEMPTRKEDGYLVAETEQLGKFKLGEASTSVPANTALLGNYPNPFNPYTKIQFYISPDDSKQTVALNIYNIKGELVTTLMNKKLPYGEHSILWNGKDEENKSVNSGMYLYTLTVGDKTYTHKMLLLK